MKKQSQLGMNPSTASGRLVKDILFKLVSDGGYVCYHCKQVMTRDTFSIEHKTPWLDSDDPVGLYFDLENIDFSHLRCNIKASRYTPKPMLGCGTNASYHRGCRCEDCKEAKYKYRAESYSQDKRKEQYARTGN